MLDENGFVAQRLALQLPPRRAAKTVKMRPISRAKGGQLQAPVRPLAEDVFLSCEVQYLPSKASLASRLMRKIVTVRAAMLEHRWRNTCRQQHAVTVSITLTTISPLTLISEQIRE